MARSSSHAASVLWSGALAQELEVGSGVVCDTSEQAERYIVLFKGSTREALMQVNAEANGNEACAIITVAYLRGRKVSRVVGDEAAFDVVRILIVGLVTANGTQNVSPFVQFTLFKIEERVA